MSSNFYFCCFSTLSLSKSFLDIDPNFFKDKLYGNTSLLKKLQQLHIVSKMESKFFVWTDLDTPSVLFAHHTTG